MKRANKIKIRKFRELLSKEQGLKYEDEFQEQRLDNKRSKYKNPHYWNEESKKALSKIENKYGCRKVKLPSYVDEDLNILH